MTRKLILVFLAALIITGLAYWFFTHKADKEVVIMFDRANGIEPGSRLVLEGVPVGEVKGLSIGEGGITVVEAAIREEYKDKINSSSVFIIENSQVSGKRQITVEVLDGNASPLPEGATVEGYSSRAEFFVRTGERVLEGAYESLEDWVEEFGRGVEDLRKSEKGKKLREDIEGLMEEARRSAERGIEELREEIPRLKEELNEILEELRKLGRDEDAEDLREGFDRYLESLKDKAGKAQLTPQIDAATALAVSTL